MKISLNKYAKLLFEITNNKNSEEVKEEISKFIELLIKKNQIKNIGKIIKKFEEIWDKENNIIQAEAITVHALKKEIFSEIEKFISEKTNAEKIKIKNTLNKDIISGIIIKYGDRIFDNSLKTKIDNLKIQISK